MPSPNDLPQLPEISPATFEALAALVNLSTCRDLSAPLRPRRGECF
jgi:hypothetical protein